MVVVVVVVVPKVDCDRSFKALMQAALVGLPSSDFAWIWLLLVLVVHRTFRESLSPSRQ